MSRDRGFTKPLTCAQCGQSFALDTCLAAHRTIEHLEKPPHRCAVCKFAFFSSIAYNDHLVRHSLQRDSPQAYYTCSECSLDFPSEHGMRVHLSTHTGLSVQSRGFANVRRYHLFHCPLCPEELVGRKLYHEHIRMHKKQKVVGVGVGVAAVPAPLPPSSSSSSSTAADVGDGGGGGGEKGGGEADDTMTMTLSRQQEVGGEELTSEAME